MAEIKNLYICCEEGREEFFQEKAKDIYKEYICIQDEIGKDTDMIVIIQPTEKSENRGTLILDATCCPADIHYPTDAGLLNHARELVEKMIDRLGKDIWHTSRSVPILYEKRGWCSVGICNISSEISATSRRWWPTACPYRCWGMTYTGSCW